MPLPPELQSAITEEAMRFDRRRLLTAARQLYERYDRGGFHEPAISGPEHRIAYLQARLPATFAAVQHVFEAARERLPNLGLKTLADLGAGPGTAFWAALSCFPDLDAATLIEQDAGMVELGRRLAGHSPRAKLVHTAWMQQDVIGALLAPHDAVVISYLLGELPPVKLKRLVAKAWAATGTLLAIIEPGVPTNFQAMLAARQLLIDAGAHIVAPCPHHQTCPLAGDDWCHFAVRVQRTADHRRLKDGTLSYEDEKFSYLVASRQPAEWPEARIVRHPLFRPGHVKMTLCTAGGLRQETIGKSQKERYRTARQASWGDAWELHPARDGKKKARGY
jgi:ribosomal protein RSM22 (predicted rRNA methylase)